MQKRNTLAILMFRIIYFLGQAALLLTSNLNVALIIVVWSFTPTFTAKSDVD